MSAELVRADLERRGALKYMQHIAALWRVRPAMYEEKMQQARKKYNNSVKKLERIRHELQA